MDLDLRIGVGPAGHDLRGTQRLTSVDQMHRARKFGQISGLFDGRVATTHNHQWLVSKTRQRSVADRAGAHPSILEMLLAGQPQPIGTGSGGHDHALCLDHASFTGVESEGPL